MIFPANIFDPASKSSMLGLGDIVIPGILVALMLRLDDHVSLLPGLDDFISRLDFIFDDSVFRDPLEVINIL